jgi:hypothetical protein
VQLLDCNLKHSNLELTLEISLNVNHQKINFFTIKLKVGAKPNNEYDNSDDRDNPTDRRGQLGPHRQIVHRLFQTNRHRKSIKSEKRNFAFKSSENISTSRF